MQKRCLIWEVLQLKKALLPIILVFILALLCSCSTGKDIINELKPTTTAIPTVRITFREGLTAEECGKLLEENGVCSLDDFLAAVNSPAESYDFLSGITNPQERPFILEGYLFPDTYEFYYDMDAQAVLKKFLNNYETKIKPEYVERADELGYTMDEIIRIASIIQEEAVDSEMKTVSSVLHNRLNSSYGKLECDVTIFYLNNHVKPYVEDVSVYSPLYNAYKFSGLPAGPITNVGINAIEAALYPADTDYYFFLTDSDMNFHYAVTWKEHSKNVDLYYNK